METYKDIEKYASFISKHRIICQCGHRVLLTKFHDRTLCKWCGRYVYLDKKTEFKYKAKETINKKKLEEKI